MTQKETEVMEGKEIEEGNKPKRIQRKRTKGWKMPENTIYVGRPTKWGNPYKVGEMQWGPLSKGGLVTPADREMCSELYRQYMVDGLHASHDTWIKHALHELKGKNLACFCPLDQPCHADILLELANPLA